MESIESFVLGLLLDISTKSNFFLLFIQNFYYCYRKIFPDNKIELLIGCYSPILLVKDFDPRIASGMIYFQISTSLKFLDRTEASIIASIASTIILNHRIIPEELMIALYCFLNLQTFSILHMKHNKAIKVVIFSFAAQTIIFIPSTETHAFLLNNINYLLYWAAVSSISILTAILANYLQVSLMIQRKIFHLMLILIFIPGLQVKVLLSFAFLTALYALILLEGLRPHIKVLNDFFLKFIDDRDSKDIILTHIYLLFGFGFPVFFSVLFKDDRLAWAGIVSLGIGDSAACLIGFYFGRIRLPYRKKTFEGTAAGFVAMCLVFRWFGILDQGNATALFLTAVYEAYTLKIDNLVLPVFTFFLFSILNH